MRRIIRPIVIIISVMMISSFGFEDGNNLPYQIATIDSKKLDGNNISTWYTNDGTFNRNYLTGNAGFEWPKGSGIPVRYASGIWLGGVVGNDTLMAIAEFHSEYLPGFINENGNPQGKDDPNYRMYKIVRGDSLSTDYIDWPGSQGAYVNENGKPFQLGQQTLFCSFTDGYAESHTVSAGGTAPLNAVILKTSWCYMDSVNGPLDNTIFTEYRIINKSNVSWDKLYVGLWTNDVLGAGHDAWIGCDSILDLNFTYNLDDNDPLYGTAPPSVGLLLLKGPSVDSPSDTVRYYSPPGSSNLIIEPGSKNLKYSSMCNLTDGSDPSVGFPLNYQQALLALKGFKVTGLNWINPLTNLVTYFPFSGDPETGTGWNMNAIGDLMYLNATGPFSSIQNDTQYIVTAQIIARGINNKNSVTKLKKFSKIIKAFYDNNFKKELPAVPSPAVNAYAPGNGKVYLTWNDIAEKDSMENKFSGGVYRFEGYNIYQINSYSLNPSSSDTVLIKTFDKANGIKDIRDSIYINGYEGIVYGIVQRGSDNGIQRYLEIGKDTISNGSFINGTQYKFLVTAYFYDPLGGIYTLPKVIESSNSKIIKVTPQNLTPLTNINNSFGDTIITDQYDLAVMPVVTDPLKLVSASYVTFFGGTMQNPDWSLIKIVNGTIDTPYRNILFTETPIQDAKNIGGFSLVTQRIRDSGIVRDAHDRYEEFIPGVINNYSRGKGWTYEPEGKEWFRGPDTSAIELPNTKIIRGRQFDSRSLGMSFPTQGTFKNQRCRVMANAKFLASPDTGSSHLPIGGPLRKIQIVFGESSMAYRYIPVDTNLNNTPFANMVSVPFKVFAVDELDSSGGTPRQLNCAFVDSDSSGTWNPDTSVLGGYEFTFVFTTNYNTVPDIQYTSRNILLAMPSIGFPSFDVMYAWLPRVKSVNGIPQQWSNGDKLTVWPYRITRPEFVPGYPVKYSWRVNGTEFNNTQNAMAEIQNIKAFPNPYYGFSELEYNDAGEKFIYFSHLPAVCDILIYTLDGVLAKKIQRNNKDPNNTLEKWDLKNNNGSNVASGMYLVYIDCKELGTKILKLAVFQNKF